MRKRVTNDTIIDIRSWLVVMTSPKLDTPIRTKLEAALDSCFRNATSRSDVLRFLDAVRIPVIVTDAGHAPSGPRILFVNAAMCELCAYRRDQMVGRSPHMLQGPATDRTRARAFRDELEAEGRATVRLTNYRGDGSAYDVLIRAGKLDLGTRLDDQLRIAFETEVADPPD
jgi:PAS domain S-box-containing protein